MKKIVSTLFLFSLILISFSPETYRGPASSEELSESRIENICKGLLKVASISLEKQIERLALPVVLMGSAMSDIHINPELTEDTLLGDPLKITLPEGQALKAPKVLAYSDALKSEPVPFYGRTIIIYPETITPFSESEKNRHLYNFGI